MSNAKVPVTVIGLGPMGQAMVRQFLAAGNAVTVWNRTESKAEAMAAEGAIKAASLAEALEANTLIVVSLTHYEAVRKVLEPVAQHLKGRIIVNMTSGNPTETAEGAAWLGEQGARQLTGGPMTQSDNLTHELNYVFYSGPRHLYEAYEETLAPLSRPEYIGEDPATANLYYQTMLNLFHPMLLAFEQARATIERWGEDPDRFLPFAQHVPKTLPDFMAFTNMMAKDGGWGGVSELKMMHAGAQHVIDTSEQVGVDASVIRAVQDIYSRSLEASEKKGEPVPTYQTIRGH
ncbi:NAD(P)-dependent oxidoreductase [Natronoglycomyces albus]|uniref:NAD(P)-dependent oxidoreductase n=1 Tax=Natronoglycomyces albus TaxID=2811108 RepID=A0A895XPV8_9ACTN|nr:NAD(P)-binding domain-containing protein [Natronoglycomyces albus]QSB05762.1 NAD(P)-dependent oxidoreductase [Natronoglycomyces albus]